MSGINNITGKTIIKESAKTRPKMILFDYGQTLIDEQPFDGVKGTEAVLKYAVEPKSRMLASVGPWRMPRGSKPPLLQRGL